MAEHAVAYTQHFKQYCISALITTVPPVVLPLLDRHCSLQSLAQDRNVDEAGSLFSNQSG